MSAIANIYNVPSTDSELASWAFAHMAHHRDINRRIYELVSISLPEYTLDPIDPNDVGQWEYQHQLMHNNQNQVLGIMGFDLSEVNWQDSNLLAGWIWLNASEHLQAADILEIG